MVLNEDTTHLEAATPPQAAEEGTAEEAGENENKKRERKEEKGIFAIFQNGKNP